MTFWPGNMTYGEWVMTADEKLGDPMFVKEALAGPNKAECKTALEKEIKSLRESNLWELVG